MTAAPPSADGLRTGPPTTGRLRVEWSPGSDLLTGACHCGAQHTAEDPAEIWTWLLAHPDHPAGRADALQRPVSLG